MYKCPCVYCVFLNVYMSVVCTYVYTCLHVCYVVYLHACLCLCVLCVCMCVLLCTCVYVHMSVLHICMCTSVYVSVLCICTCVYVYKHTHHTKQTLMWKAGYTVELEN